MTAAHAVEPIADLSGAAAATSRGRRREDGVLGGRMPPQVYDEPAVWMRGLLGSGLIVADPAGVKRVLVDNAANYPKMDIEQKFFVSIFGAGLLGTDGELWRRHRRIMAPAFTPSSVAAYGPAMAAASADFLARWEERPAGDAIQMDQEMTRLTLQIICRTMFSAGAEEIEALYGATMDNLMELTRPSLFDLLPLLGDWRFAWRARRARQIFAPLDAAFERMIAERKARPLDHPDDDLLARLIAARDDEGGGGMTGAEVRDQLVTIFMAGHETTASAMTFTWYLLARHPEVAARLRAELAAVLGGRTPGQDDIEALTYTRAVINEAMRLYPPAPGVSTRVALGPDEICGHPVRKGTLVAVAPWITQRHRKLWTDPERFDPGRFLPEHAKARPRFAYFPFGGGPRICIGQLMALNEAVLILATLAQRYAPELEPGFQLRLRHNVTLRPRDGLPMTLRPV